MKTQLFAPAGMNGGNMLQEVSQDFMQWYNIPVRFEIVKCTKKREFAFLKGLNIRALNLYYIDQMDTLLKLSDYEAKRPNMYTSVAQLDFIPQFTYNLTRRSKETSVWFKEEYHKHVVGYDLFLDWDMEEGESLSSVQRS